MYYKLALNNFVKIKPNEKMLSVVLDKTRTNIVINESAYDVLRYCNGMHSKSEILENLSHSYSNFEEYTMDFLNRNLKMGILEQCEFKESRNIVKGNENFYYPDILIWEITDKCPLKCKHCYLGEKKRKQLDKSKIDEVISLIEEKGITTVQLTGGEIFTHPDLDYIIDKLNSLDIIISLSTSGYILNENAKKIIDKLKSNSVVRVSIDGDSEYHNEVRQNKNAYEKCIEFIKYLKERNIQVQVGTVIFDQSEKMVIDMIERVKELGVSSHSFSVVLEEGSALSNNEKSIYTNSALLEKLEEWSEKYSTSTYKIQLPENNGLNNCGCGYKLIRLKEDYTITPCPMIDYRIGDLKEETFDKIMERGSQIFENIYSPKHEKRSYCDECVFEKECGDCIAMALVKNRNSGNQCIWVKENLENMKNLFRSDKLCNLNNV